MDIGALPRGPFAHLRASDPVFADAPVAERAESGFSDVTPSASRAGSASRTRRGMKTETEIRDKREQRRMKNRISAAKSRQRKTDTFETLQRELGEAKMVIETLTRQLDRAGGRTVVAGPVLAVPVDLRQVVGRDYVPADFLMDLLRMYIRKAEGGGGR